MYRLSQASLASDGFGARFESSRARAIGMNFSSNSLVTCFSFGESPIMADFVRPPKRRAASGSPRPAS